MSARDTTGPDHRAVTGSPIHRAMTEVDVPFALFDARDERPPEAAMSAMHRSLGVARRHVDAGTAYDADGPVAKAVETDLAAAGYWGLRVPEAYGGTGASCSAWAPFVGQMATVDPWIAALSSPHAALGPVNLVGTFGTEDQQARLLPPLASGARLGAFAVTEPATASDWDAIRTTAVRQGDTLLLRGEKMFITNAAPGRTVAVLCHLDGRLTMVIVETPAIEDDHFHTVRYELRAPRHLVNRALIFHDLAVPASNALEADGRKVAFHGLNHGRVLVGAFAAGALRSMAGILIPWVQTRETFGAVIGSRELVQRRLGRLAGRIVAADALVAWSAQLLDEGFRGELECVTVKVIASELLKEAAVDVLLKTHGSRAFLPGNLFADAAHDLLAPTVFEGENEILTLGSFSTMVKARLAGAVPPATRAPGGPGAPSLDLDELAAHATASLLATGREIDDAVARHGTELATRQAAAFELAQRAQLATTQLVVARYGARQPDGLVRQAAACMASELAQRLTGSRPGDAYVRQLTELGASVAEDRFGPVRGVGRTSVRVPDHLELELPARSGRS